MKKTILICGLIAGLIASSGFLFSMISAPDDMNFDSGMIYGFAAMFLAFTLIFVGVKNQRDRFGNGTITFKSAFLTGLYITLLASTVYVLVWLVYYYNFIPDFGERYSQYSIEKLQLAGATASEIEEKRTEMAAFSELYKNPLAVSFFTYLEILPVGLLFSVAAALILKRKSGHTTETAGGNSAL